MNRPPPEESPLAALRDEIDGIDDTIHDLIMRRMALANRISETKRARGATGALLRPAREAAILRRLEARHAGPFPFPVIVRIWSEIMAATLVAEGGFAVSVFTLDDPGEESRFPDLARVHFGAEAPLLTARTESGVLRGVRDGKASLGVLPVPADAMSGDVGVSAEPWWLTLAVSDEERPMIVARLPWIDGAKSSAGKTRALVVAMTRPAPSGDDVSYLAVQSSDTISRDRIRSALAVAGIAVTGSVAWHDENGAPGRWQLIEVNGFVTEDDGRLGEFAERLGDDVGRIEVLGSYPRPPAPRRKR